MASQQEYIEELKSQIEFLQLECDILNKQHKRKPAQKRTPRPKTKPKVPTSSCTRSRSVNKENCGSKEVTKTKALAVHSRNNAALSMEHKSGELTLYLQDCFMRFLGI